MPKKPRTRGRYNHDVIAERVECARQKSGMLVKDLAAAADLQTWAWYKKSRRLGSTFTLDELSAIADALNAPEGWPFVEWK